MEDTASPASPTSAAPASKDQLRETLIAGEKILAKFHPHPVSFMPWYLPSILLFIWTATYLVILAFFASLFNEFRSFMGGGSDLAPLLFWAIGAFLIGLIMPRDARTSKQNVTASTFLKAVHYLYFALLALPFILYFVFRLKAAAVELTPWVQVYAILLSLLMLLFYDLYRRSFTYFVTNFRVIFRYRFFKTAENNLRFSQVRDVEIDRSFLQRLFKLGNVRPYTGAEESMVDLTPGYDSPDECFFGVRNPEYVKRLILEQMLGPTDTIHASVYGTGGKGLGGVPPVPPGGEPAAPLQPKAPTEGDADRVKRLEKELEELRTKQGPAVPVAKETRTPAPPPAPEAAKGAPSKTTRLSDVTPTLGVRETTKSHAEFGDDRDAFAPSDESFRGAQRKDKKPSTEPADEDDKPRGI